MLNKKSREELYSREGKVKYSIFRIRIHYEFIVYYY